MSRFKHPNIMPLIGVYLDGGSTPYIVMPYMNNGSLLEFLKHRRNELVVLEGTDITEVISCHKAVQ